MVIANPPAIQDADFYPTGDGKPMAETETHLMQGIYLIEALRERYKNEDNVYVCGNNFIYYEQGNQRAVVSPDCYVVFDVVKRTRDIYLVWEENGTTPDVVFEVTSKATKAEDARKKFALYEQRLGVSEYFLFDPTGDYLNPRLQGYRLVEGRYQPIAAVEGRLHSEQLGLDLIVQDDILWLFDPVEQEFLLSYEEVCYRYEVTRKRALIMETIADRSQAAFLDMREVAEEERRRADAVEQRAQAEAQRADIEAQKAIAEAQRADIEAQRASAEAQRADMEAQRAQAEAQARTEAEAENARLRAELAALREQK